MEHSSCELHRHLDNVPPETPIRDVVDRCRGLESHADPEIWRVSKPGPEPGYPAYVFSEPDKEVDDMRVVVVAPVPEPPAVERLLQRLVAETKVRQPVPVVASELAGLETLLRSLLSGHLAPAQQPRPGSFPCDWNAVVCFSCGKAGHSATRCPTLNRLLMIITIPREGVAAGTRDPSVYDRHGNTVGACMGFGSAGRGDQSLMCWEIGIHSCRFG